MKAIHRTLFLLPVGLLAGVLTAQAPTYVRPAFNATNEGNAALTYPFGRGVSSSGRDYNSAIQTILESSFVTNLPTALIAAIHFRHDGEDPTDTWPGFTQTILVQLATVQTTPETMVLDDTANLGGARPVTVFGGAYNFPASNAQPIAPRAFFQIPFNAPYTYEAYNPSTMLLENLLIDVRVIELPADMRFNVDSTPFRTSSPEGDTALYVADCQNANMESLRWTPSKNNMVPGGSLDGTLQSRLNTSSMPGLFPVAVLAVGATHSEIDLSVLGMTGCWWSPSMDILTAMSDTGAGFPAYSLPVPNNPLLTGAALYTQAIGLSTSLATSVTSAAHWVRVGPEVAAGSPWPFGTIFCSNVPEQWYTLNNLGPYGLVIGFTGTL